MPKAHIEVGMGMTVAEAKILLDVLGDQEDGHVSDPLWQALYNTMDEAGLLN